MYWSLINETWSKGVETWWKRYILYRALYHRFNSTLTVGFLRLFQFQGKCTRAVSLSFNQTEWMKHFCRPHPLANSIKSVRDSPKQYTRILCEYLCSVPDGVFKWNFPQSWLRKFDEISCRWEDTFRNQRAVFPFCTFALPFSFFSISRYHGVTFPYRRKFEANSPWNSLSNNAVEIHYRP